MVSGEIIGPATLSISQGIAAFFTFLPRLSEVRKATPEENPELAADVRIGEVAATAVCVGVGVITSSLTGSPVPAFVAVVVALVLIGVYETTLNTDPVERKTVRFTGNA